jgi:hypothetical protein
VTDDDRLRAGYATSQEPADPVRYAAGALGVQFDRWEGLYLIGSSRCVLVVADIDFGGYTGPPGRNLGADEVGRRDGVVAAD